eukprot:COSAG06_NODE_17571_length_933_cov_1.363309_1_plen_310_part_11
MSRVEEVHCPSGWQGNFTVSGCLPPESWTESGLAGALGWCAFCLLWSVIFARAAMRGRQSEWDPCVLYSATAFWVLEGITCALRGLDRYTLHQSPHSLFGYAVVFLQLVAAGLTFIWDCHYLWAGQQFSVRKLWIGWMGVACSAFVAYALLSQSEAFGAGAPMITLMMFETAQLLRMFLCVAFVRGAKHGKPHRDATIHALSMWLLWGAHIYMTFVLFSSRGGHFIETERTMPSLYGVQAITAMAFNYSLMCLAEKHSVFTPVPGQEQGGDEGEGWSSVWLGLGRSKAVGNAAPGNVASWRTVHLYPEKV